MSVCPHKTWQDVPLNGRKCVDCGMWLEDYPETRPQPTTSVDAEQVWRGHLDTACELIQEAKGVEGPDSGYVTDHLDAAENWIERAVAAIQAYGDARADAARREALEQAVEKLDGIYREMCGQHGADSGEAGAAFYARKTIYELKENTNG